VNAKQHNDETVAQPKRDPHLAKIRPFVSSRLFVGLKLDGCRSPVSAVRLTRVPNFFQKMFGRRKQQPKRPFSPKQKQLPARFAERILQLEMDLDYHCNLGTLKQLLELYSQAIEFFESLNDPRHM
jgi:hypothetical protein